MSRKMWAVRSALVCVVAASVSMAGAAGADKIITSPGPGRIARALAVTVPVRPAASATQSAVNACDLNGDGTVNRSDVDLAINMTLGLASCTANILGPGICNVVVVQRIVNASMGAACDTATPHSVTLSWVASTSPGVAGYRVFRGTTSGGPYTPLNSSSLATGTSYVDGTVQAGQTYYYVVTAIDGSNNSSVYSNEAQAVVPLP